MKKSIFAILVILSVGIWSCQEENYNYQAMIEVNYNPVRLDDSLTFTLKKVATDNLRIDSLRIGDTLSLKIKVYDLKYDLKTVKIVTDTSFQLILSDGKTFRDAFTSASNFATGDLKFKSGVKVHNLEMKYISLKSSKTSALKVYLETENTNAVNQKDSLKLSTPVKFLP